MFTYEMRPSRITSVCTARYALLSTTRWVRASSSSGARRAVEVLARAARVVERDLARPVERARRAHAEERAVEGAARERLADDRVLARREDQRERRRAVAQVGSGDLPGLRRETGAVEDVVRDLEGDAEREPEGAEALVPRGEQAGRLEQAPRLERAPLEVRVDRRVGVVELPPLHRLAAREVDRGRREDPDALLVAGRGELGERAREQVVAARERRGRAVRRPRRGAAAPELRRVEDVVVDERGHVEELHRRRGRERRRRVERGREEAQRRPEPLPAGGERLGADRRHDALAAPDDRRQALLELVEEGREAAAPP